VLNFVVLGCIRDDNFLQNYRLNIENVLDYFYLSPFYDKNSNNEIIKMQHLDSKLLKGMTGVEYNLEDGYDDLYILSKIRRFSQNNFEILNYYYILIGTIYQCPDIGSVLDARIVFL
jgi:mediator of RNA polymerase II transcription subunit 6